MLIVIFVIKYKKFSQEKCVWICEQIVEVGLLLLVKNKLSNILILEVVIIVGVFNGIFYNYFDFKKELVEVVVYYFLDRFVG